MKRVMMLVVVLGVLSGIGSGQSNPPVHVELKTPIGASSSSQTLWVKVSVGSVSVKSYFKDMKAIVYIAKYDPNWGNVLIPGIGGALGLNPALLIFHDPKPTIILVRRDQQYPYYSDRWLVWTKLPPLPIELVGMMFAVQLLCWDNGGPPRYALSRSVSPWAHGVFDAPIVIVPK